MEITRTDLLAEIRLWCGTPYRLSGTHRDLGVNCMGLIFGVGRDIGVLPMWEIFKPFAGMAKPESNWSLVYRLKHFLEEIPIADAQAGDILLFNQFSYSAIHVAFIATVTGPCKFDIVHADMDAGRVVEKHLVHKPMSAYRIPGVIDG